jgi:thiamine-phosphate pyrophosphorylase
MTRFPRPGTAVRPAIFYVTDRKVLSGASCAKLLEKIRTAVAAQVDVVQIRERDLPAGELLKLLREAVAIAAAAAQQGAGGTRIVVNDRLDVALASGAAGVHLSGSSIAVQEVVRWCRAGNAPRDFLIGVSCHSLEEARMAEEAAADYIFFGPIFDTPSKRPFGPPQGLDALAALCREMTTPVIAIGGVNESNARDCLKAGASGVAAIRLIQEADSADALKATLAEIRRAAADEPAKR